MSSRPLTTPSPPPPPPPPNDGVVLKDPWTGTWKLPRWIVRLFGG